jgi:pimeloyl-ACP methyl ester carboxylesterase
MTSGNEQTIVLVHGAWHGGWCYRRVADLLRGAGHRVYTPTLTGLGERSHLLSRSINLSTHIADGRQILPRYSPYRGRGSSSSWCECRQRVFGSADPG